MRKAIHVKGYYRKRHGRAKFGGKVHQHHRLITIKKSSTIGEKEVRTLPSDQIVRLAHHIKKELSPLSQKVEIAGSIRRKKKRGISDIDIVLIPKKNKYPEIIHHLSEMGETMERGESKAVFLVDGVKVELYFTKPESWGATLYYATGPGGANIGRRALAKQHGMLLNRWGLFGRGDGKKIAGRTEREIYSALGREYKPPEGRG